MLTRRELFKSFFFALLPLRALHIPKVFPDQVIFVSTHAFPPFEGLCLRGKEKVSEMKWQCLDIGLLRLVRIRVPVPQECGGFRVVLLSKDETVFEGQMEMNHFYFGL